jgi:hypothetical protein
MKLSLEAISISVKTAVYLYQGAVIISIRVSRKAVPTLDAT